jgi:hypothetical protein
MSANSVDSDQYVDGSIDTVHLADDAVTGAKLADNIDIAGTLDVTGILTADSNVVVAGNLTVNGTTTTLNTATLDVEDKNITINYGAGDTSASANGAGITIQDAIDASNDATILWDTTNDEFDFSHAINVAGNIAVSGTVDGRDVATDGTKLDGIESSATADQTAAEIRTAVEAATDSNVFTDADHTKLNAIEALADVTDATNVTAAGALMDSELTAIASVKALNQGVATTDSPTFVNVTGTLATAAQPNITSVGTLTALNVSATTPTINLQDSNGAGNAATPILQYKDSGGTDLGYVGYGSSGNSTLSIVNIANDNIDFLTNGEQSLRITAAGSVGIGETTPSHKLSVVGVVEAAAGTELNNADSGANFLHYSPNGYSYFNGAHGANGVFFGEASGATRLLVTSGHIMQFETNSSERMRIDSTGRLLIGHTSAVGGHSELLGIDCDASSSYGIFISGNGSGATQTAVRFFDSGASAGVVGAITFTTDSTAYATSSDARLKDITGEARGLEVINELNPVAYNWKKSGKADEGLIAQEVLDLVPNAVHQSTDDEMYSMDYSKLVVHLVKAVQEQQAQIEALQSEINLLKGE